MQEIKKCKYFKDKKSIPKWAWSKDFIQKVSKQENDKNFEYYFGSIPIIKNINLESVFNDQK